MTRIYHIFVVKKYLITEYVLNTEILVTFDYKMRTEFVSLTHDCTHCLIVTEYMLRIDKININYYSMNSFNQKCIKTFVLLINI